MSNKLANRWDYFKKIETTYDLESSWHTLRCADHTGVLVQVQPDGVALQWVDAAQQQRWVYPELLAHHAEVLQDLLTCPADALKARLATLTHTQAEPAPVTLAEVQAEIHPVSARRLETLWHQIDGLPDDYIMRQSVNSLKAWRYTREVKRLRNSPNTGRLTDLIDLLERLNTTSPRAMQTDAVLRVALSQQIHGITRVVERWMEKDTTHPKTRAQLAHSCKLLTQCREVLRELHRQAQPDARPTGPAPV